jgi:hypothetical protein
MYWKPRISGLEYDSPSIYMVQGPKCGRSGNLGTSGYPTGLKLYGFRGLVRSLVTSRNDSAATIKDDETLSCGRLEELGKLNKLNNELVNDKLIQVVADYEVLILAYELIKSNPGNMTKGVGAQTLDKIDLKWFRYVEPTIKPFIETNSRH